MSIASMTNDMLRYQGLEQAQQFLDEAQAVLCYIASFADKKESAAATLLLSRIREAEKHAFSTEEV